MNPACHQKLLLVHDHLFEHPRLLDALVLGVVEHRYHVCVLRIDAAHVGLSLVSLIVVYGVLQSALPYTLLALPPLLGFLLILVKLIRLTLIVSFIVLISTSQCLIAC